MWIDILRSVIVLLIIAFVWRFVARTFRPRQPIEPADEADILAGLQPRPTLNSGAVALDEPDDELEGDTDVSLDDKRQARSQVAADARLVRAKNAKAMAGEPEIILSVFTLIIRYLADREHLTRTSVENRRFHSERGCW